MKVIDFLRYVIDRDELSIVDYLKDIDRQPFFLVAATGLGKTVAVPLHVFIRLMQQVGQHADPHPQIWVIEPRIPIAIDQMKFMNSLWHEYLSTKRERRLPSLFGCISSASGNVHPDAPIKFVTTGIFGLMAKRGELSPLRDRVIVDEAHVTVEQNPEVELGIALARCAGVTVDYMSATVDTANLMEFLKIENIIRADQQRYTIWKHNLLLPVEEALPDLLKNTLVEPNPTSPFFPQRNQHRDATEITRAVMEPGRSHGMLIIVNSFSGDQSDVQRIANVVRKTYPALAVLHLASEVVRDARRSKEFSARLKEIESAGRNYIILATSVVEMGITFPTLDYVITMDSGYDQETIGDVTFPVVGPLGVNSLLQRIGRVGRRRPGIAYISYEVGADYAELDDYKLNDNALQYEPIRFPMASAPLMPLAYYACTQECKDLGAWVASLGLPSHIEADLDRMEHLREQISVLEDLGLARDGSLTELGARMEQWIGRADLAYTVQLQRRFDDNCDLAELMFWLVATALSNTPLATLRAQHDFFVDYNRDHVQLPHDIEIWSGYSHEDIALFGLISSVATISAASLFGSKIYRLDDLDNFEFERWCGLAGVEARKLQKAGAAVSDFWKLFTRVNGKSDHFGELFGGQRQPSLTSLSWPQLHGDLSVSSIRGQLQALVGGTTVQLTANEVGGFDWRDTMHGHTGMMNQDDSPIRLQSGDTYTARPVPSRERKGAEATWRVAHLGEPLAIEAKSPVSSRSAGRIRASKAPVAPAKADTTPVKRSWLHRFLDKLKSDVNNGD